MEYLGIPFSVKNVPCLQPDFLPFAPWRTAYLSQARQPFRIAVEGSGTVVYETRIRGGSPADLQYLERTIKLLLWSVGGWRVTLQGDGVLISQLGEIFSPHGSRAFDVAMMETVYGRPFCVEAAGERFPEPRPAARPIGGSTPRRWSGTPRPPPTPSIISGRCSAPSARRRPICPVWMPSASPPPASSGEMS